MYEDTAISNRMREHPTVFAARFSRSRGLLLFIACRVLGSNEGAEDAIQSTWLTASRNLPRFEHEGAFRSWVLRILIDEAFVVRRKKKELARHARCGKATESDSSKCVYEVESTPKLTGEMSDCGNYPEQPLRNAL